MVVHSTMKAYGVPLALMHAVDQALAVALLTRPPRGGAGRQRAGEPAAAEAGQPQQPERQAGEKAGAQAGGRRGGKRAGKAAGAQQEEGGGGGGRKRKKK